MRVDDLELSPPELLHLDVETLRRTPSSLSTASSTKAAASGRIVLGVVLEKHPTAIAIALCGLRFMDSSAATRRGAGQI
jgi:hypothetical protein